MQTKELHRLAWMQSSGTVADEARQSLPVPILRSGELLLCFFFCPSVVKPGEGARLAPPEYLATLSASTGKLTKLEAVSQSLYEVLTAVQALVGSIHLASCEGRTFRGTWEPDQRSWRNLAS